MSIIKGLSAATPRLMKQQKTNEKRYADVPKCGDTKPHARVIYYHNEGETKSALVPPEYILNTGEADPNYDLNSSAYLNLLKRWHYIHSFCQKRSPENPKQNALYAMLSKQPRYAISRGQFRKIKKCVAPPSHYKGIVLVGKGKHSYIATHHRIAILTKNERPLPEKYLSYAQRIAATFGADRVCRVTLSKRNHVLMYEYFYAKRAGGTKKPHPGIPACGKGLTAYRIVKSTLKKGKSEIGLHRPTNGLFLWQSDLKPDNDDDEVKLEELRERYVSNWSFHKRFEKMLAGPLSIFGILRRLNNYTDAVSRTRICQGVINGAIDCVSRSDEEDCKHARYALFLEMIIPGADFNQLMMQPVPKRLEDRTILFEQVQEAMPPIMRKCMNINLFQELYKDMRRRGLSYDLATKDWATIEANTKKLADRIETMMAEKAVFSMDRRRYLMKIIAAGQEAIRSDEEIAEIADDIAHVSKNADEFLYKLQSVVIMRYANMLNHENIKEKGAGIGKDFDYVARLTESNIRSGRIHFRVKTLGEEVWGGLASYDHRTNTVILPPLDTDMPVLFYWMENIVHELYHSAQDAVKQRETFINVEWAAHTRGIKASILLMRKIEREKGIQFAIRPWEVSRDMIHAQQEENIEAMRCMGWKAKQIKEQQNYLKQLMTLHQSAVDGFARELDGEKEPEAHQAMRTYVEHLTYMTHNSSMSFGEMVTLGWLNELGFPATLIDRRRGAFVDLKLQYKNASAGPVTPDHIQWYFEMLSDFNAITSADYYMNGSKVAATPDAQLTEWNEKILEEFQRTRPNFNGI